MKRITDKGTNRSVPLPVVLLCRGRIQCEKMDVPKSNDFIQFKLDAYKEIIKKFLLDGK